MNETFNLVLGLELNMQNAKDSKSYFGFRDIEGRNGMFISQ